MPCFQGPAKGQQWRHFPGDRMPHIQPMLCQYRRCNVPVADRGLMLLEPARQGPASLPNVTTLVGSTRNPVNNTRLHQAINSVLGPQVVTVTGEAGASRNPQRRQDPLDGFGHPFNIREDHNRPRRGRGRGVMCWWVKPRADVRTRWSVW